MTDRAARRRAGRLAEAVAWKAKHDNLLTILNAVLLAYGDGPDCRLAVHHHLYAGRIARSIDIANLGDRIVLSLAPVTPAEPPEKEDTE